MIGANFAKIATKKVCILVTEFTMKRIVLETEKKRTSPQESAWSCVFFEFPSNIL